MSISKYYGNANGETPTGPGWPRRSNLFTMVVPSVFGIHRRRASGVAD